MSPKKTARPMIFIRASSLIAKMPKFPPGATVSLIEEVRVKGDIHVGTVMLHPITSNYVLIDWGRGISDWRHYSVLKEVHT